MPSRSVWKVHNAEHRRRVPSDMVISENRMSIKTINSQLPKVTICVPVRNGALAIRRTLDSLLNQDYPNYEIIVSDNCSDDETAEIVKQYSSNSVKYFFNPILEKGGAEGNWNHVLTLADGPFIALYHADDIYTPTMVRRQVEFLLQYPEASAVFTMTQTIDECDRPIKMGIIKLPRELRGKEIFHYEDFLNYTLKYSTFVPVPTMMSKREIIDCVGLFRWEKFASASDIDLYLRMARVGPIGVIDEPLHKYRISSQQESARIFRQRTFLMHFFDVIDHYISQPEMKGLIPKDALSLYRMQRAADQILCSMNLLIQGRTEEAKRQLKEALSWRHFIISVKRPRLFARYCAGILFMVSSLLGLGNFFGRQVNAFYQRDLMKRRMPI